MSPLRTLGVGVSLGVLAPENPLGSPRLDTGKGPFSPRRSPSQGDSFCVSFSKVLFQHRRKPVLGNRALHRKVIPLKNHQHLCRLGAPTPPPDEPPFLPAPGARGAPITPSRAPAGGRDSVRGRGHPSGGPPRAPGLTPRPARPAVPPTGLAAIRRRPFVPPPAG